MSAVPFNTDKAPKPVAAYSQAVKAGGEYHDECEARVVRERYECIARVALDMDDVIMDNMTKTAGRHGTQMPRVRNTQNDTDSTTKRAMFL